MRLIFTLAILLLSACGQRGAPPAPAPAAPSATAPIWFICDAIDAPRLLLLERRTVDRRVRVQRFEKPSGASLGEAEIEIGEAEGAAGSLYTPLSRAGAEYGVIRQTNPGMLEAPGSAYTPRIVSVRLGEEEVECRWLPRTRLMAFTGRRSIVVHEDADGDLIYSSFNFDDPNAQTPIDLSENGRSTPFSAEVRGGEEALSPEGARFNFTAPDGYVYAIETRRDGTGRLAVAQDGSPVQEEPLVAFQLGQ